MTDENVTCSGSIDHTECAVCGYQPDPDRVPPHYVLSLSDEDIDDEYVQSYPFGGSVSVPFACSDECWLDAQDDPDLVADGGRESGTDQGDIVYLAGLGLSEGGHYSMEVFSEIEDAKEYAESSFSGDREWSVQPNLDHDPDSGALIETGETHYYGFEHERKGFVKEMEVK